MREWLPPFSVEIKRYGTDYGDFAFFHEADFIVSERFARLARGSGLAGLCAFDQVAVTREIGRRDRRKPPPRYFRVTTPRSNAAVDEKLSSILRSEPVTCLVCREAGVEAVSGFAIEAGTWSGEDVFSVRGMPGIVVATHRFYRFVQQHEISNITFVSTAEYRWPPSWS